MLDAFPQSAYLETQIATATPQRLRLMLIEGALRTARKTAEAWEQERKDEALESLIRCRAIVTELIAGIRAGSSPLADKVLSLYLFLFQELTETQFSGDPDKLSGVIRVLEEERTTWQELCEALPASGRSPVSQQREVIAPVSLGSSPSSASSESISLEA